MPRSTHNPKLGFVRWTGLFFFLFSRYPLLMLIICSGPDTFNARQKARELVAAFRMKYDGAGFATETMVELDLRALLNKLSVPSLFSSKKLIRCDGLLKNMKVADVRMLVQRLTADGDQTIVLTLEEESPALKIMNELKDMKPIHYPFPQLTGPAFMTWCKKRASQLGRSLSQAEEIARRTNGDTWLAEQEFMKCTANPQAPLIENETNKGIFEVADTYLQQAPDWRNAIASQEQEQLMPVLLSQIRSWIRIRDNAAETLHPYMKKKISMQSFSSIKSENKHLSVVQTVGALRTGLSTSSEEGVLL